MKIAGFLIAAWFVFACAGSVRSLRAEENKKPAPRPQKATAAQLLADAERALGLIGKAVLESNDNSIDLRNARQQPFWTALKKTDESIIRIQEELSERDPAFFDALNASTQAVAELKSALPRAGIKNAKVDLGVKTLSDALTVLRRNYGIVALRKKKGNEMSEQERAEFTALKDGEKQLVAKLRVLEDAVKSNAPLKTEVAHLIAQLQKSIDAPFNVQEYYAALELVDVVEGEWNAYSYYVDPKNREAWQKAQVKESLKTVSSADKSSTKDLPPLDWEELEDYTEVPPTYNVSVEIEIDEVEGYIHYIEETVDGIEVDVYYVEMLPDFDPNDFIEQFPDENQ